MNDWKHTFKNSNYIKSKISKWTEWTGMSVSISSALQRTKQTLKKLSTNSTLLLGCEFFRVSQKYFETKWIFFHSKVDFNSIHLVILLAPILSDSWMHPWGDGFWPILKWNWMHWCFPHDEPKFQACGSLL